VDQSEQQIEHIRVRMVHPKTSVAGTAVLMPIPMMVLMLGSM
jgi:hypothetical protein